MGVTNLHLYYLATKILVIHDWYNGGWSDPAYQTELRNMDFPQLQGYLYGAPIPRELPTITRTVLVAWRTALRYTHWDKRLTRNTPLWHSTWLYEVSSLLGFRKWDLIGVTLLGDIWTGDHIRTFPDLQQRHALSGSQFYKYLQVRHALTTHVPTGTSLPEFSPLEAQVMTGNLGRGGVSRIYRSLVNNGSPTLNALRTSWEGWLGPLEDEDWRDALMAPKTLTTSSKLHLIQLYFLHTAYLTPVRLHRAGLRPSPNCVRCGHAPTDFYHVAWGCPALAQFWPGIESELTQTLGCTFHMTLYACSWGCLRDWTGPERIKSF